MDSDLQFSEPEPDIATELLNRYQASVNEHHHHICATIGAMSQTLKDNTLPQTPVSYFGATISALERQSRDPSSGSDPVTCALLSVLAFVMTRVSPGVVRKKWEYANDMVVKVLSSAGLPVVGVEAGIKCLASLLKVADKGSWDKIDGTFRFLIKFATDSRAKVRKQSHACLFDVLESFQGSPAIINGSEIITNVYERSLLLAGGSNSTTTDTSEGPKGATDALYIMNALKTSLTLLTTKYTTTIMKNCKALMEVRQPIVTRTIMEMLQNFCCSSSSEVASEALLDLLCSLSICISSKGCSADEMAYIARLLHNGMRKAYDLNRKTCIVKLPHVFNTLGDILASVHEEAAFASTEAMKGLISYCIDESIVTQGVEQIKLSAEGGTRKSAPTIIEKICCTFEGLLGNRYNAVWDMSFQVLSAAFSKLGKSSSFLMVESVRSLANLQSLPDENLPFRKQLHECVGSAVAAVGPEIFLSILPLDLGLEETSESNIWLLPILKQYIVGTHLKFFAENILNMTGILEKKSRKFEAEGRTFSARNAEGLTYQLWALLPAFCNYPVDTASHFKDLCKILCLKLPQAPELHGIICSSLQILIRQNKTGLEEDSTMPDYELSDSEKNAKEHYTRDVAEQNLNAIRSSSSKLLSVLSDVFLKCSKDNGGCLKSTIHELASILEKKPVKNFFKKVMIKLLRVTEASKANQQSSDMQIDDESSNDASLSHSRGLLLDLAVSLLPGVDKEETDLLFTAIKSLLQDKDGLLQKKAYKTLATMLKESDEFIGNKADEVICLMIEATDSCHFSAKRHRLESLYHLVVFVSKDTSEQRKRDSISAFLTEIILALKEANRKTRNTAYDLLVQIGHAYEDEDHGAQKENLLRFFHTIAGGLASEKPHMISAAVKGLARLAYEFSDLISAAYKLLPSSFLLLQRKNREIVKANLGLIKVLVARSKADALQTHLKMMVEGLLKWQDDTKNHFKAKVKLLLEMLVKKCGMEAVRAVMPEEHMKLLTNIRKLKERKERQAKSEEGSESARTKTSFSRQSRWNHTRIFSDVGDDNDDSDEENYGAKSIKSSMRSMHKSKASKKHPEYLFDQMEDDPLDLLDEQKTRAALRNSKLKRKAEFNDEPEFDSDGRLIVREDGSYLKKLEDHNSDKDVDTKSRKSAKSASNKSQKKKQKTSSSGYAYTGDEYTNKKASGDLKKKDKLDPYAYWPLDRKLLNRRSERKASARKGMASVMKFTKKFEGKSASDLLASRGLVMKKRAKKGGMKRH